MEQGDGGARRAGLLVLGFCLVGLVMFAVIDRSGAGDLAAGSGGDVDAVSDTEPCGGSTAVEDAVRASSDFSGVSDLFDVNDVLVATSDPTWGSFAAVAKAGREAEFQNEIGVVQCTTSGWTITDYGFAPGCTGADAPPVAVRTELGLACPS